MRGHVGSCVLVEAPVSGVTGTIKFEITQSLEGLLEQRCGFIPSKEVVVEHTEGLAPVLGLLVFLDMLPCRVGSKNRE